MNYANTTERGLDYNESLTFSNHRIKKKNMDGEIYRDDLIMGYQQPKF